ncbi:splicing factor Cwf28 [Schizosaccharomyces octosporus yFS286]|uniref:Pre-mRNA-splicing factor n=1 Tax=Schizosaccharomyces octosporus (strain yFS286) TaxID=483514 RepID=S9PTC8_SCHOY|nr:splicing factor Cwf28 [Schizosaccharomyces octosporus yFS286]EPX71232.1 splicing factor Cwf28 [Schizosaccharomyces octosporus yFS286]
MKRRAILEAFQGSDDEEDALKDPQFITGLNKDGDIEYKDKEIQQAHFERKNPKIIHVPANKSWLEDRKKRIEQQRSKKETENAPERLPEIGLNYGLNVKQSAVELTKLEDTDRFSNVEARSVVSSVSDQEANKKEDNPNIPLEVKMILENQNGENALSDSSQAKIISNQAENEREMYNRDIELLPDSSNLRDYADIPVEDFGAAMLRGMGWNGKLSSKEAFEVNRRPTFLGMGAKPMDLGVPEVGSWGKQDPKKTMFLPVKAVGDNSTEKSNHNTQVESVRSSSSVSPQREREDRRLSPSVGRRTARSPSPSRSSRHRKHYSSSSERVRDYDTYSYHRHHSRDDHTYRERKRRDRISDYDHRRKRR